MKPKEILKRIYYALTSGLLLIVINRMLGYCPHSSISIAITMIIGMAYCWIMSRHNNKRDSLIIYSIILLAFIFVIAYNLAAFRHYSNILLGARGTMLHVCSACMAVVGFYSNTKYYNILPNQSKTISIVFRVFSWIGQIVVWVYIPIFG